MIFIFAVLFTIVAFFVWRTATRKVKQNNLTLRPVRIGSLLAIGVFGILALIQCFTQILAGHVGVVDCIREDASGRNQFDESICARHQILHSD
jgi:hypothetical protein